MNYIITPVSIIPTMATDHFIWDECCRLNHIYIYAMLYLREYDGKLQNIISHSEEWNPIGKCTSSSLMSVGNNMVILFEDTRTGQKVWSHFWFEKDGEE
jgi:hypothetical protein